MVSNIMSWFEAFRGTLTDPHDVLVSKEADYVAPLFANNGVVRCSVCGKWCAGGTCAECAYAEKRSS